VVVTIHDLIPLLFPEYRTGLWVRAYMGLVSAAARRAEHIIADSLCTQRDIVNLLGIPEGRVTVVYLAAGDEFQPAAQDESDGLVRGRYRLEAPYILYLGGFDRRKNLDGLLRAYALARTRYGFPHKLAIAGRLPTVGSPFTPDPRRMAHDLGPEGNVAFLGWVEEEDRAALYRGAALFVFPSLYEGFGLPLLEAMACGVPVVASDAGSLPEVVGEGGVLVNPRDVHSLAEAMGEVLSDGALARELAARALRQAQRFSWHKAARETLDIYRTVLG
jgi:glycosyltransferase involved in cell wall biosynthesis